MNFKKIYLPIFAAAALSLTACGSDSSSSASPAEDASSSSAAQIVLPEANGDSFFTVSSFKGDNISATKLKFSGSVSVNFDKDTSTVIDSIDFKLGNESGYEASSNFEFNQLTGPTTMISIGQLDATLDISSMAECGTFTIYMVVYGHNDEMVLVKTASTVFERSGSQCVEESSSSSVEVDPEFSVWNVTLSTSATGYNAVDLDSKTVYIATMVDANAEAVDLYLVKEGSAILYTNANLGVVESSVIAEETKSMSSYSDYPEPAHMSDFAYKSTTISASDFETVQAYVVITSAFDASTGKGFFVVFPHSVQKVGSSVSLELTVLGNWD